MKRVAIVGSGPCGLAALKEMRDAGHDAVAFERSGALGGIFSTAAAYPDLHLTISNWCMAFSDYPDPQRLCYPSAKEYLQYLHSYAQHFNLEQHIQYNSEVTSAQLDQNRKWELEVCQGKPGAQSTQRFVVDALVVSTGAHHVPNERPKELAGFSGPVLHSNEYGEEFKQKVVEQKLRVLVVGGGESAADISAELAELSPTLTVWLRRPHCFGPRYLNSRDEMAQVAINKSKDFPANSFLEAATTNRLSAAQNVYFYGFWRRVLWNLPILNHALNQMCLESTRGAFFLNDQATFVTKNQRLCEAVGHGKAHVIVSPTLLSDGLTCQFQNGQQCEFDAVVLCHGYRTVFPWLKIESLDPNPRSWFLHAFPADLGHCLAFVGYARPHQGGIPPMAEMQARYAAQIFKGDKALPSDYALLAQHDAMAERGYYHISPDLNTLVDYAAFLENVGRRAGCEPNLPLFCVFLFNLHMAAVALVLASWLGLVNCAAHAFSLWAATLGGFILIDDGLMIKWWLYPQWPVWYRQRGPGAKPSLLLAQLRRVPLWRSTAMTPGFVLLVMWGVPTFYLQRLISPILIIPHLLLNATGVRFREGWGGLLRPKIVVLHSGIWRFSDLFLP